MQRFILHVVLSLGCAFAPCLNVASAASDESKTSLPLDEDNYRAYVDKIAKAERDRAGTMKAVEYPYIESFQELAAAGAANIELCVRYLAERGMRTRYSSSIRCINSMSMATTFS